MSSGFHHLRVAKDKQMSLDKYYLEALISSLHCTSPSYEDTDWKTITYLYVQLEQLDPRSIAVTLNRLIAESNYKNINVLLAELKSMEAFMTDDTAFFFLSTKAHFYSRLKIWDLALENYRLSLDYTNNKTDIHFIMEKIALINTFN